jgi:hypothetical protein
MKTKYGNSFNYGAGEKCSISVEAIWPRADKFYPTGAFVAVDSTYKVGTKIPAGTPAEISKIGGTPKLGSAATNPVGLTYEDAYVGTDGASIAIVTAGDFNESLSEAVITDEQKEKLTGITFIKEA